jgi:hypothetical protein|tara:strand:- start:689 stop:1090 length:402 start_codon:yes stop_codon:yes gene_type:complete
MELISMLGGGLAGFIFRFMAMSVENQQKTTEMLLQKQAAADDSADRAAKRGTHLGRRVLVFTVLWVLAVAPFLGALLGIDTWVQTDRAPWDLFGIFTGGWVDLKGIIVLPELRAALLAAVGFYLGGSSIARGK